MEEKENKRESNSKMNAPKSKEGKINPIKRLRNWVKKNVKIKQPDKLMARGTLVLAITAIITNVFTYFQITDSGKTTKELFKREDISNTLNRKHDSLVIKMQDSMFRFENRAFITVASGTIHFASNPKHNKRTGIVFKGIYINGGRTPAYNVQARFLIEVIDSMGLCKFKPPYDIVLNSPDNTIIPANQASLAFAFHDFYVADTMLILTNKESIVIYGNIRYEDAFQKHHLLHFSCIHNSMFLPSFSGENNCVNWGNNYED
jgi:hypothetical protein